MGLPWRSQGHCSCVTIILGVKGRVRKSDDYRHAYRPKFLLRLQNTSLLHQRGMRMIDHTFSYTRYQILCEHKNAMSIDAQAPLGIRVCHGSPPCSPTPTPPPTLAVYQGLPVQHHIMEKATYDKDKLGVEVVVAWAASLVPPPPCRA